MPTINDVSEALGQLPVTHLGFVVALAALGLAAFAIYAVFSLAREKGRR